MDFRTELKVSKCNYTIDFSSKIFTIGSCFSKVIGDFLDQNKFVVSNNSFGTVYNLASIAYLLQNSIELNKIDEDLLVLRDEVFYHHHYHSDFRNFSSEKLIQNLENIHKEANDFLKKANILVITLGTSWVYTCNNQIVNNCHKVPAKKFTKKLLELDEQKTLWDTLMKNLNRHNPNLKILLTVSPVRHIKDGIVENSESKSILRLLASYAQKTYKNVSYFPSYEIMMDDLRDYRFYSSDLIHPNEMAERYIIEKFKNVYISDENIKVLEQWAKIRSSLLHKPFNAESVSHQSFLLNLQQKIRHFESYFSVDEELQMVNEQLKQN